MATITAEFSRWEGAKAYIDYYVDGFLLGVKYYVNVVKWDPDGGCHTKATWGFTYDPKYKAKTGYIPGYKIDDGDITLTLAVLVWSVQKIMDACWEGEYQSTYIEASADVYIPKKTIPCTQSLKVIDELTRNPISGASATIWELPYPECTTGTDGKCSIANLVTGKTYNIAVNKTGYYAGGGDYTVCNGEITIELEPACVEIGKTRCIGNDLYECVDHKWVLSQAYSPECLPACEDYDNQIECESAGCHWYNGSCHTNPPSCSELDNQADCGRFGCHWYGGICHTEPAPECYPEGSHEVLEYCPDGVTEKRWRNCVSGKWVEDSRVCPCSPEGAHEVLEYCPDEVTEKRWRDCIGGAWVEYFLPCPACIEGERDVIEYCPDGVTWRLWWECIEEEWKHKSQKCPPAEGDRKCINFDLYEYQSGEWVLIEPRSFECIVCPIAVIAHGTELVDALGPIREFRDRYLKSNRAGRKFVSFYYGALTSWLSPLLMHHNQLKRVGRMFIVHPLKKLCEAVRRK